MNEYKVFFVFPKVMRTIQLGTILLGHMSQLPFKIIFYSSNDIYSGNNYRCGDGLALRIVIRVFMKITHIIG